MKIKRILSMMIATLVLMVGIIGCSNSPSGKNTSSDTAGVNKEITLKLITGSGKDLLDYAIDKVNEKYPNVKFEVEPWPQDGGQSLKARAATGSLPDIMWLNSGLILPFAKSGSLVKLDKYVEESGFEDTLNDAAKRYSLTSPDGHNYVFSVDGVQPLLWYYNKELFAQNNIKVPENYDELLAAVKAFRSKEIVPMALFGKEPWPLGAFFEAFAMKEEPSGVRNFAEGTGKASDAGYTKAINKMKAIVDAGMFQEGVTNADYDTALSMFTSGKAAMFQNGSWNVGDLTKALGDKVGYLAAYPTGDAGNTSNDANFAGGGDTVGYGVSANTADVDLAADVARILAIAAGEYNYGYLGSVGSVVDTSKVQLVNPLPPMAEALAKQIPAMNFESSMLQNFPNTQFSTGFAEEMQKLLVGKFVDDFIKDLDKLIDKSNK